MLTVKAGAGLGAAGLIIFKTTSNEITSAVADAQAFEHPSEDAGIQADYYIDFRFSGLKNRYKKLPRAIRVVCVQTSLRWMVGYVYQQITDDFGAAPFLGEFRSRFSACRPPDWVPFPDWREAGIPQS